MSGIALGILGLCLVGGAIFAIFWARRNKRNMKASYPGKEEGFFFGCETKIIKLIHVLFLFS